MPDGSSLMYSISAYSCGISLEAFYHHVAHFIDAPSPLAIAPNPSFLGKLGPHGSLNLSLVDASPARGYKEHPDRHLSTQPHQRRVLESNGLLCG